MDCSYQERPLEEYYNYDYYPTKYSNGMSFHDEMMFDASGSTESVTGSYMDHDYPHEQDLLGPLDDQEDDSSITEDYYDGHASLMMGKSSRRGSLEFMISRGSLRCDNLTDLYNSNREFRLEFDCIQEEEQRQEQQQQHETSNNNNNNNSISSLQDFWDARMSTFSNNMNVLQANWKDWCTERQQQQSSRASNTSTISTLSTSTSTRLEELEPEELPDLEPMAKHEDDNDDDDDSLSSPNHGFKQAQQKEVAGVLLLEEDNDQQDNNNNPIQKFVQARRNTFIQNVEFVKRQSSSSSNNKDQQKGGGGFFSFLERT